MAKRFSELIAKMSPDSRARLKAKAERMLVDMRRLERLVEDALEQVEGDG